MSDPFVQECVSLLSRTPAVLDSLLRGLPEFLTSATEGPGTWSAHTVVGHLTYAERVDWMPRLKIILEVGASRPFDPFDREGHFREIEGKPFDTLLDEFAGARRNNLEGLRELNLQTEHLELFGTHPALGPVTARQLLAAWTAHDLTHYAQIVRVLGKRYKQDVGPWAQYLSVVR